MSSNEQTTAAHGATRSSQVDAIRRRHQQHAHLNRIREYTKSRQQLIDELTIERNAKNKAYYFILSQGHFDAFAEYCGAR